MKKTLIALALFASCGSAVAASWVQNGTGGNVELGGTLTPAEVVTPWEVMVGAGNTSLDQTIRTGSTSAVITTSQSIPVLGIRNKDVNGFAGQEGIKPQIDYKGAVDLDAFSAGITTLTLDVTDNAGNTIGKLSAPFAAAGVVSWVTNDDGSDWNHYKSVMAPSSGNGFYGGVGSDSTQVPTGEAAIALIKSISPDFIANFDFAGKTEQNPGSEAFYWSGLIYTGAYGSGIQSGSQVTLTMNSPVTAETTWKASLPVTVSYQ